MYIQKIPVREPEIVQVKPTGDLCNFFLSSSIRIYFNYFASLTACFLKPWRIQISTLLCVAHKLGEKNVQQTT